ncbi:MAG: hypothetical protein ACXWIQ_05700 [Caldimonas sp.]
MKHRGIAAALAAGLACLAIGADAASIVAATPQGEVAQVRQVSVRFSEPRRSFRSGSVRCRHA